jgi:hypothetical protein
MFRKSKFVLATAVLSLVLTSVSHANILATFTANPNPVAAGTETDLTLSVTATADGASICGVPCSNPEITSVTGTFDFADGSNFTIPPGFLSVALPFPTLLLTIGHIYSQPDTQYGADFTGTIEMTEDGVTTLDGLPTSTQFTLLAIYGFNPEEDRPPLVVGVQTLPTPTPTATPLPATLPLFATGIGGLGLLGWRRKRGAQAVKSFSSS